MKNDTNDLLKQWFLTEKRTFPWRNESSPYAVWVSEVMLQQTQASVVVPYFQRWMEQFPTIRDLANASLDTVIKAWEGLGYYSRVRNLHAGACYVVENFDGELPRDVVGLSKIKGIGPYTLGAIRSFAFKQKAAAVDGNVLRVISRLFHIEEDICLPSTVKKITRLTEEFLPDHEPWITAEALIELGATICTKKPKCPGCPLRSACLAYRHGDAELLPLKSKKVRIEKLHRAVAIITSSTGQLLVKRVQSGKIMSDLHEFPYFEMNATEMSSELIQKHILLSMGIEVKFERDLPIMQHSFTRYKVNLYPLVFHCSSPNDVTDYQWFSPEELKKIAFSAGHRRLYQCYSAMVAEVA